MRIVEPQAIHMPHDCSPEQFIERIGRTCYKSEDKITEDSAKKFVAGLIRSKHWAMLEHEIIYMTLQKGVMSSFWNDLREMNISTEFLDTTTVPRNFDDVMNPNNETNNFDILSGSIRAFYDVFKAYQDFKATQMNPESVKPFVLSIPIDFTIALVKEAYPWGFEDIDYPPTLNNVDIHKTRENKVYSRDEFIAFCETLGNFGQKILFRHLNHTVRFSVDRGVTHEYCRHRRVAYAMESTRYCNYEKGKFGNEITVVKPPFYTRWTEDYKTWEDGCKHDEETYMKLISMGHTAQEARDNLPHSVKADLIMTATEEEWQHIINLRDLGTTGSPHPQAKEAMALWSAQMMKITNGRVNYNAATK